MKTNFLKLLTILVTLIFLGAGTALAKDRHGDRNQKRVNKNDVHHKIDRQRNYGHGKQYKKHAPTKHHGRYPKYYGKPLRPSIATVSTGNIIMVTDRWFTNATVIITTAPLAIHPIAVFRSEWQYSTPTWPFQSVSMVVDISTDSIIASEQKIGQGLQTKFCKPSLLFSPF